MFVTLTLFPVNHRHLKLEMWRMKRARRWIEELKIKNLAPPLKTKVLKIFLKIRKFQWQKKICCGKKNNTFLRKKKIKWRFWRKENSNGRRKSAAERRITPFWEKKKSCRKKFWMNILKKRKLQWQKKICCRNNSNTFLRKNKNEEKLKMKIFCKRRN